MWSRKVLLSSIAVVAIVAVLSAMAAQAGSGTESAKHLNQQGIRAANRGRLTEALSKFQEAVSLDRGNADYLNNVGVTHMRLSQFAEARAAFEKAITVRPGGAQDARKNLEELRELEASAGGSSGSATAAPAAAAAAATASASSGTAAATGATDGTAKPLSAKAKHRAAMADPKRLSRKQDQHTLMELPRIHVRDLYKPENAIYADGRHPFILVGALDHWNLADWSPERLASDFADSIVDFYPHNMDSLGVHPYLVEMRQAVSEMFDPTGQFPDNKKVPGTYIQWNVGIDDWDRLRARMPDLPYAFRVDDEWLAACLPDRSLQNEFSKKVHWRMVLIGNEGAGMFNHIDVLRTASWQAQVAGAKKWHICAPDQTRFMHGAGGVDVFHPDYDAAPEFRNARCFQVVVRAGEMIFYGDSYWHSTVNLETPSIAVSATVLDQNCWREISTELKNECAFKKFNWGFSPELCAGLEKCHEFWRQRYDTKLDRGKCTLNSPERAQHLADEHDEL